MATYKTEYPPGVETWPTPLGEPLTRWKFLTAGRRLHRAGIPLFRESRWLTVDVALDYQALRPMIPLFMSIGSAPMGTLFFAHHVAPVFAPPFREAALLVHVRTVFGAGRHVLWMLADSDTAMAIGRETTGYPKKMGSIDFESTGEDSPLWGRAERRGTKILEMKAIRRSREGAPQVVGGFPTYNVGGLGSLLWIAPIWKFAGEEVIHESWQVDVDLEVNSSVYDPIAPLLRDYPRRCQGRFAVVDIVKARYCFPVGLAGAGAFVKAFTLRYR